MKTFLILCVTLISLNLFGKAEPVRAKLTPEDVCKSIDSDKYEAQCRTAVHNGYFDEKATEVCFSEKSNYDKKTCMEAIRGKDYNQVQINACKKNKKVSVVQCLNLNGELRKEKAPSDAAATPVEN